MTDDELIKWMGQGWEEVEQKPADWNAPEKVTVDGVVFWKYVGRAHDQLFRHWKIPANLRQMERLGFERVRNEYGWWVTFMQPIDSEAHAYFPQANPETDDEPPSTMEAITAFIEMDREYTVSEIVGSLERKGFERDRIAEQIEKLVAENWLKRRADGRVFNPPPF